MKLSTVNEGRGADLARILRTIADEVEQIPDDTDTDEFEDFLPRWNDHGEWFIERETTTPM